MRPSKYLLPLGILAVGIGWSMLTGSRFQGFLLVVIGGILCAYLIGGEVRKKLSARPPFILLNIGALAPAAKPVLPTTPARSLRGPHLVVVSHSRREFRAARNYTVATIKVQNVFDGESTAAKNLRVHMTYYQGGSKRVLATTPRSLWLRGLVEAAGEIDLLPGEVGTIGVAYAPVTAEGIEWYSSCWPDEAVPINDCKRIEMRILADEEDDPLLVLSIVFDPLNVETNAISSVLQLKMHLSQVVSE